MIKNKTNAEKLENTLLGEKEHEISLKAWLKNPTPQGLPRRDIKGPDSDEDKLIYWPPKDGRVAGFEVSSGNILLDCRLKPFKIDSGPVFGVRAAKQLD
jgi:hypothetical protein